MASEALMRNRVWRLALALFLAPAIFAIPPQQGKTNRVPPPWAYGLKTPLGSPPSEEPTPTPTEKLAVEDGKVISLPGSPVSLTLTQMRNQGTVDWYPDDHPKMPDIVSQGRKPGVLACPACHYTNGKGDPANATIEALPYDYFVQTMEDFKAGLRKSADSRKYNTPNMIKYAQEMTDDEIKASAKYYGAIPLISRIKVIESKTVPKTRLVAAGLYFPLPGNETEPLGHRIGQSAPQPVTDEIACRAVRPPRDRDAWPRPGVLDRSLSPLDDRLLAGVFRFGGADLCSPQRNLRAVLFVRR